MRHNFVRAFLFSPVLLFLLCVSANAQEAPSVLTQANAPGWITISWEHTGQDVYYFLVERMDPPYAQNSALLIAQSNNRTDSLTDKNLRADTIYKYHVCAVYLSFRTCSDWISVRTLSPPPPSSGGSTGSTPVPVPVRTPLATPVLTATRDHDPKRLLLDWSGDPGWESYQTDAAGNTYYKHGQLTALNLYDAIPGQPNSQRAFYVESKRTDGVFISLLSLKINVIPNFVYNFKVCFSRDDETKCSKEITTSGRPVAPTAPVNVSVSQEKRHGNATDPLARIRTLLTARWSNTAIRGQFITLEREDRVQIDQIRVGPRWVEIKRISSIGNPFDPTDLIVDVTPKGPESSGQGNSYRVCAVVPALGDAGVVCSSPVTLGAAPAPAPTPIKPTPRVPRPSDATSGTVRPICELATTARERNSPAAAGLEQTCLAVKKGEVLANQDPLALELRNQQSDDAARQGFDFGMALAEGQTLPGPGKDKACADRNSPAEQGGCRVAVLFSVDRNRNAKLAAKGAEIARADEGVAAVRNAETDVFYRLGFDIATGIFGNPALGASGNTVTGPGSLGIRDALNAAAQRGFNTSVKLHLSRKY